MKWADSVEVDELNWEPIAIVQKFQSLATGYDRVILLAAIERQGRNIGDITVYKWMGKLPHEELIQRCIGDAVTGVISVENLLIIGEYFKIWTGEIFCCGCRAGTGTGRRKFYRRNATGNS